MKSLPGNNRLIAWLTAMVASISPGATPPVSPSQDDATHRLQPAAAIVALPTAGGPFQLKLGLSNARDTLLPLNAYALDACGEALLTAPAAWIPPNSVDTNFAAMADVLVDGQGMDPAFTNSLAVVEQLSGKDWEYVVVDAAPAYGNRLIRFRRHVLFVQTNLFVIYDDLAAPTPVLFEYRLHSPGALSLDERSGDLRLELPKAGLIAHWLSPANDHFGKWRPIHATPGASLDFLPGQTLCAVATNRLAQLRALTAMLPHCAGQNRGTGFKLLESDTAIGARVYRDGLPALVAFRTVTAGEANLTGLKFTAPVAVDVFRPKPRRR